ncbi:unnamed protein product, partial [marine sediment metagenome]
KQLVVGGSLSLKAIHHYHRLAWSQRLKEPYQKAKEWVPTKPQDRQTWLRFLINPRFL